MDGTLFGCPVHIFFLTIFADHLSALFELNWIVLDKMHKAEQKKYLPLCGSDCFVDISLFRAALPSEI